MRLVDADKVKREYPWKDDVQYAMRNAPTVNAIPIEWIRNYVSIWISEPYKNFVLNMITKWEKENETN